jgi:predicted nucleic acid-binding Zn ribbon protein
MNSALETPAPAEQVTFARAAVRSIPVSARGTVVNRTHRVVRERARVLSERKSRVRSLMLPMVLCGVLLTLTILAVWTGLYQYQGAMEADVAALAAVELNNHALVALLWFVPVTLGVLVTMWMRRARGGAEDEAR